MHIGDTYRILAVHELDAETPTLFSRVDQQHMSYNQAPHSPYGYPAPLRDDNRSPFAYVVYKNV